MAPAPELEGAEQAAAEEVTAVRQAPPDGTPEPRAEHGVASDASLGSSPFSDEGAPAEGQEPNAVMLSSLSEGDGSLIPLNAGALGGLDDAAMGMLSQAFDDQGPRRRHERVDGMGMPSGEGDRPFAPRASTIRLKRPPETSAHLSLTKATLESATLPNDGPGPTFQTYRRPTSSTRAVSSGCGRRRYRRGGRGGAGAKALESGEARGGTPRSCVGGHAEDDDAVFGGFTPKRVAAGAGMGLVLGLILGVALAPKSLSDLTQQTKARGMPHHPATGGDFEAALAHYRGAIKHHPNFAGALRANVDPGELGRLKLPRRLIAPIWSVRRTRPIA